MSIENEDKKARTRIQRRNFEKEWFLRAEKLLKRNIDIGNSEQKFIDFGSSACEFLENIRRKYGITGIAADYSRFALEYAESEGFEAFWFDGNESSSLPEKYYGYVDFATSIENIEHITNIDGMMKIVYKSLKNSGLFVLTTPNSSSIENCANMVYFGEPLNEGHHYRFLTRSKVYNFLVLNGFDVVDEENLVRLGRRWQVINYALNIIVSLTRPLAGWCMQTKEFKKKFKYAMDFNVREWGIAAKKDEKFVPLGINLVPMKDIPDGQKEYMVEKIRKTLFEKGFLSQSFFDNVVNVIYGR